MRDHCREAASLVCGKERESIDDRLMELALIRLLEVAGEAANRLPLETRESYPDIPWGQIIGLRNRLIHGYDSVDPDVLWQVATTDLPRLLPLLNAAIEAEAARR